MVNSFFYWNLEHDFTQNTKIGAGFMKNCREKSGKLSELPSLNCQFSLSLALTERENW